MTDRLRMLCWEGYETAAIADRFRQQSGLDFVGETLLSDAEAASRLYQGEIGQWDVLNINNAWIRDFLYPKGLIRELSQDRFLEYSDSIHPVYEPLLPWSYNDQDQLIGIGQRFGPFNLVVNTDAISASSAENEGFDLANDSRNAGRFGILNYPDFNVFHFCLGSGLNPFTELDDTELEQVRSLATRWYRNARYVEDDHHILNQALIKGEIDFYISGGIYTASPARMEGMLNIQAITPRHGPMNGKGGIVFSEITSVLNHPGVHPEAEHYLEFMLNPEVATGIAFVDGTCNPVAQMGDPAVFAAFDQKQLAAIQWEQLESDLACCASYQIPPQNDLLLQILTEAKDDCGW